MVLLPSSEEWERKVLHGDPEVAKDLLDQRSKMEEVEPKTTH